MDATKEQPATTPVATTVNPEDVKVGAVTTPATTEQPKIDQPKPETVSGQDKQLATPEKKQLTPEEKRIKALKRDLWERAERERALSAELKAIKEQIAKPATVTEAKTDTPELLDNPAEWAKRIEEGAATKAEHNLMAKLAEQREAERLRVENEEGVDLILSDKAIKDNEEATAQVVEILHEPIFAHIAAKSPKYAAQLALTEFNKRNGMGEERKATVAATMAATQTTTMTPAPVGVKTWKRGEIEAYISAGADMADMTKRRLEIQKAVRDGRVN